MHLAVVLLLALFDPSTASSLPLSRRHSSATVAERIAAAAAKLNPQSAKTRRAGTEVALGNAGGAFFVPITLGSSNQVFELQVDTGSSLTWVPSSSCNACSSTLTSSGSSSSSFTRPKGFGSSTKCQCASLNSPFNPKSSSSYQQTSTAPTTITYGSGQVQGILSTDTMTFASNTLTAQTFLLATAEDSMTSASMAGVGDGLLGLAFQDGLDSTKHHETVLYSLASQNLLPNNIFSVWLNQSSAPTKLVPVDPSGGRLILGGIDTTLYTGSLPSSP
ncbi:acid protease [Rhizoclosmatium globosum]|uniref:Acid protease n=1 Tax=Rhizoclosmatium globosum TaxID=329046 RepID=A0A1Y2BZL0_9FUNG|nr:acid protease [Rhizoclosmatium globosum]|eukprot:ORY40104.1 acid protease [Rhizoclosmatium globosum]